MSRARIAAWLPAAAALLVMLVCLLYARHTGLFYEDAFITLRYARNLGEGHGLVFNPGERVLGTTTPLLALLLAPLGALAADWLPAGAVIVGICSAGAVTGLQFRLCRRAGIADTVVLGTVLITVLSAELVTATVSGMESMLAVALMFAALTAVVEERPVSAGVVLALLLVARVDGALWVALVLAYVWISGRPLRRLAVALGLGVLPWVAFATLYYGSPIPHSLAAKFVSYEPGSFAHRWAVLWSLLHPLEGHAWFLVWGLDLLFLIGAVAAVQRRLPLAVPALAAPLHVLALAIFAPHTATWHAVPAGACYALVVAFGAATVCRWAWQGNWPVRLAVPAGLALVAVVAASQRLVASARYWKWQMANERAIARAAGEWLKSNSAPNATVFAEPLGFLGFYSRRYLWDTVGLVSPTITEYRRTFPGNRWYWESLKDLSPDLVVLRGFERPRNQAFVHGGPLFPPEGLVWFDAHYQRAALFESPHNPPDANSLVIYRRVTSVPEKNDAKN